MYGAIGQKHVTLYLHMFPKNFELEIVHLALSQYPDGMIKKSQIVLFVNIKAKVRSGCVSVRAVRYMRGNKRVIYVCKSNAMRFTNASI